jgi:hypothetical protein
LRRKGPAKLRGLFALPQDMLPAILLAGAL